MPNKLESLLRQYGINVGDLEPKPDGCMLQRMLRRARSRKRDPEEQFDSLPWGDNDQNDEMQYRILDTGVAGVGENQPYTLIGACSDDGIILGNT